MTPQEFQELWENQQCEKRARAFIGFSNQKKSFIEVEVFLTTSWVWTYEHVENYDPEKSAFQTWFNWQLKGAWRSIMRETYEMVRWKNLTLLSRDDIETKDSINLYSFREWLERPAPLMSIRTAIRQLREYSLNDGHTDTVEILDAVMGLVRDGVFPTIRRIALRTGFSFMQVQRRWVVIQAMVRELHHENEERARIGDVVSRT